MIVNLGRDLHLDPAPEPLLAPPDDMVWETMLVSEDPRYGGCGSPVPDSEENWRIVGHAAIVLRSVPAQRVPKKQLNLKKEQKKEAE
jgi:maltooligosyltrehalose trehalohydrolase